MVVEVLADSDNLSAASSNVFDANEDVAIRTPEGIGKPEEVLQHLRLVIETGFDKAVLISLEIECIAFFLVKENFEQCWIHQPIFADSAGPTQRSRGGRDFAQAERHSQVRRRP